MWPGAIKPASMASESDRDSDREDSVFTDCPSGNDSLPGQRKRQMSVPEMVREVERKRAKRQLASRKSRSPRERKQPRAAGPGRTAPAQAEVTLQAIQQLIEAGNTRVIKALEARFAQQERRIEALEAECHVKDITIQELNQEVRSQRQEIVDLREKMDNIDMNRRLSSLILTCEEFGQRAANEDIESMSVRVLNKRFSDLKLTTADIQAAHRLQGRGKVIVKFVKRSVRDELYERRFELADRRSGAGPAGPGRRAAPGDTQMAALYLNESLIPEHQSIYSELLAARRPEGGAKVASVFTRRGHVFCRKERGGENIRIRDRQHLQQILRGGPHLPPPGAAGGPHGRAAAGGTGSRPAGTGRGGADRGDQRGPAAVAPSPCADSGPKRPQDPAGTSAPGKDVVIEDAVSERRDGSVCASLGSDVAGTDTGERADFEPFAAPDLESGQCRPGAKISS